MSGDMLATLTYSGMITGMASVLVYGLMPELQLVQDGLVQ